jgi:hypothetical protein
MQDDGTGQVFRRVSLGAAGLAVLLIATAWLLAPHDLPAADNDGMARFLLLRQDLVITLIVAAVTALAWIPMHRLAVPNLSPRTVAIATAVIVPLGCWLGARLVFGRYDFSRDEQMASFDATIFAGGHLFAVIPAQLRGMAESFNQTFILPIGNHEAWVSAYLPMNAAIRALFLRLGDASLAGPVLVAVGALALWRIAARLWPTSPASQIVALLLYAGSSQVWITGMTAYAMSAHLGLNLLWLWLFLKDRPWAHGAAIVIGFVATGLHQPLFHPLFVLPFLAWLLAEKKWRLLLVYGAAYAAIGLFWLGWPLWISAHGAAPATAALSNVSGIGYVERLRHAVTGLHLWGVGLMAANLVRFVAWQHLLLVPLAGYGIWRCWNVDPVARALAMGLLLPVLLLLILLPYQGHGWGYRYLHGLIGSACLLGGYGWRKLEERGRAPVTAFAGATLASIALLVPLHAVMARHIVAPFAAVAAQRDATAARIVIVDDRAAPFAQDLVLNRADFANRPWILLGHQVVPAQIAGLCRGGSIAFLAAAQLGGLASAFDAPAPVTTPGYAALEEAARSPGCRVIAFAP